VSVGSTGYLPLHAPGLTPCTTAAIAARRRATWPDWRFGDDREASCRRMIQPGDAFVRLPGSRMRFCVACAAIVLGLAVRYESAGPVAGDGEAPGCC
jgi:hypothetical protein